jgi:eukaryotic-like serine/threonine-protein kinase
VLDTARGTSTKVTFDTGSNRNPVWSPDGKNIVFASNRAGRLDLYQKNADGSGEEQLLLKSDDDKQPTSWSRDGRFILYANIDPKTLADIWVLPLGDRKPFIFLRTERQEGAGRFSPDARWIAYLSDESGNPGVYVRPFSPDKGAESASGGKWLLSTNSVSPVPPRWRGDGKELFYLSQSLQQMAVSVSVEGTFHADVPKPLFVALPLVTASDGTADGQRFLFAVPEGINTGTPFTVVTNWQAALKK